MSEVLVCGTAEAIGAGPRLEVDAHGAAAPNVGARGGGDHRHRLDCVLPRGDRSKEGVRRPIEVVAVADAIERDLHEGLRQSIDPRFAIRVGGVDPGQKRHRIERVACRRGHAVQLIRVQRRRDNRRLGVDQFGAAGDVDDL